MGHGLACCRVTPVLLSRPLYLRMDAGPYPLRSLFAVMGEWSLLSGNSKSHSASSRADPRKRRNSDLLRAPDKVPELGTVCRVRTSDVRTYSHRCQRCHVSFLNTIRSVCHRRGYVRMLLLLLVDVVL